MMTKAMSRRSLPRTRASSPAAFAFAVFVAVSWFSAAAPGVAAADDDLNLLLRLLSQDVRLGTLELARPIDPLWIKDLRGLQSSSNAAVAETAGAVEESAKMREEALKILADVEAKNERLREENPVDVVDAVSGLLPDGISDEDIDEALRSGRITPSEAEAYRARRAAQDDSLMNLGKVALLSYANSYLADGTVRRTRTKAELLEAEALAQHLVPALRARAGAQRGDLPVTIVAGFGADRGRGAPLLAALFSASDEPLTQFTLLMEIRTTLGGRRAVAYIPRLEPGRGVQVAPIAYNFPVEDSSADLAQKEPANVIRHTVWCDQFTFEGEEVPYAPTKTASAAYCALAAEKGRGYSFDRLGGGRVRDWSSYTLEFTEFTLAKETCHVQGKLSYYATEDRDKPSQVTTFGSTVRGLAPPSPRSNGRKRVSPAANDTPKVIDDARLTVGSGKMKSDIDLYITESGQVELIPRTGPLQRRIVRTIEEAREAHELRADLIKHYKVLGSAREMAMDGKKEEAAQALQDYLATNPGEDRIKEAQSVLEELDALAAQGARMKEARGARGKSPNRSRLTNPRFRQRAKP